MTATATPTEPQGKKSLPTGLFVDDFKDKSKARGEATATHYAAWYDHAGRYIKRRLGPVKLRNLDDRKAMVRRLAEARGVEGGPEEDRLRVLYARQQTFTIELATEIAGHEFEVYKRANAANLCERKGIDRETLEDYAEGASFPRVVIADHIQRLCNRIASSEVANTRPGQPGLQLFAERSGINAREVHRFLSDEERITIGGDIVDKICVEFDMLLSDFVADAMDWAECRGRWANRPGTEDAWPIGYFTHQKPAKDFLS